MSREHITTTVEQTRERIRYRHEKKIQEEDDFEAPSLDGRANSPKAVGGGTASVWRVNHLSSQLVKSVIPGLREHDGRSLDWHIRDAI